MGGSVADRGNGGLEHDVRGGDFGLPDGQADHVDTRGAETGDTFADREDWVLRDERGGGVSHRCPRHRRGSRKGRAWSPQPGGGG